jgi:hypothetical protein
MDYLQDTGAGSPYTFNTAASMNMDVDMDKHMYRADNYIEPQQQSYQPQNGTLMYNYTFPSMYNQAVLDHTTFKTATDKYRPCGPTIEHLARHSDEPPAVIAPSALFNINIRIVHSIPKELKWKQHFTLASALVYSFDEYDLVAVI